jgi:hypothetical protein
VFAAMPIRVTPIAGPSSPTSPVNKQRQIRTSTPPPPRSSTSTAHPPLAQFGCRIHIQDVVQSAHEYRTAAHFAQPAPTPRQRARRLHDAGMYLASSPFQRCSANSSSPTQRSPAASRILVSTLPSKTSRNRTPRSSRKSLNGSQSF